MTKLLPPELLAWSSYFRDQAAECRRNREALGPEHDELRRGFLVLERSWRQVERNWRRIAAMEARLDSHRPLLASFETWKAALREGAGCATGPTFHFNLVGATYVGDDIGVSLPSLAAARHHAVEVARELMQNNSDENVATWTIEVTDEEGHYLLTVPFAEVSP